MKEILKKVDNTIFRWINIKFINKTFDKIMPIIVKIKIYISNVKLLC